MVQKILDNEIINKYKINRCIPKIPKKTINNNLNGGAPNDDNIINNIIGTGFFWRLVLLHLSVLVIGGFLIQYIYNKKLYTSLFVGFYMFIILCDWYFSIYNFRELNKKDTLQQQVLYFILGDDAKITQFHKVIFFSVIVFIVFIVINISVILLIKLLEGDKDTCLKKLKLSRLEPVNILSDNSITTREFYNNRGVGQGWNRNTRQQYDITVDKDYFDLNSFIKPFLVKKENTVSQDAGVIFNPNNIEAQGQVIPAAGAGVNAALINIGQGNNNQGSIFDNRIKVVEKDIYNENEYFKENPLKLTEKLKKYFQYIYDKTEKRHFIAFEIKKYDVVNTPYGNILASQ